MKDYIGFSHFYKKLQKDEFKTVRWLDTHYVLGKTYEIIVVEKRGGFKPRRNLCLARLISMQIYRLFELMSFPGFTEEDADCGPEAYYEMMRGWYSQKPDWKEETSEVQLLTLRKVKFLGMPLKLDSTLKEGEFKLEVPSV
jgi:hypothetical protein